MPHAAKHTGKHSHLWAPALAAVLLAFYFLYTLLRLQTQLLYQAQEPVFFFDGRFARDFLTYPGGINELCSRFYLEFYYYPWTGAAALILLFGAIAWAFRQLLQALHPRGTFPYLYWVPSLFLIALHSDYTYPAALSLGVLWVLLGLLVYVRLAFLHPIGRAVLFCALQAVLYWVTAGQAFLFTLTALGYELLRRRRVELALCYAAFGALLPGLSAMTVFALHLPEAYTTNLILCGNYHLHWVTWALYACVPLLPFLGGIGSAMARAVPGVALPALAVIAALCSYDQTTQRTLLVDYYARRQDWKNVLVIAGQTQMNSDYIQYQANRALYHCGLLGEDLFDFVQHPQTKNLFLRPEASALLPLQAGDVFLDLGLVNEAQHWAHEAVSIKGDTPWTLQRLVEVNLLKGDRVVAAKYLKRLDRTLWFRNWANDHRKFLADPNAILADPRLAGIRGSMPPVDFIVPLSDLELCLTLLLDNPGGRMAFEYYMARCLMEFDLAPFAAALPRLTRFGYTRIPRHFQEAICICLQLPNLRNSVPPGLQISREIVGRFNDFNRILAKHNLNAAAARPELMVYRNTYWFYVQYYYTAGGSRT